MILTEKINECVLYISFFGSQLVPLSRLVVLRSRRGAAEGSTPQPNSRCRLMNPWSEDLHSGRRLEQGCGGVSPVTDLSCQNPIKVVPFQNSISLTWVPLAHLNRQAPKVRVRHMCRRYAVVDFVRVLRAHRRRLIIRWVDSRLTLLIGVVVALLILLPAYIGSALSLYQRRHMLGSRFTDMPLEAGAAKRVRKLVVSRLPMETTVVTCSRTGPLPLSA